MSKNNILINTIGGGGSSISVDSPAFTGIPTAPTAAEGTNTTQIATTEFVASAIDAAFANIARAEEVSF